MSEDDNHEEEPRRRHLLAPVSGSGYLFLLASPYGGTDGRVWAAGGERRRSPSPRLNRPLRLRRRERSERSTDLEEVTRETGVK